jgi:hypothetical protein
MQRVCGSFLEKVLTNSRGRPRTRRNRELCYYWGEAALFRTTAMFYYFDQLCRFVIENSDQITPAGLVQLALGVVLVGWSISRMGRSQ